MLHYLLVPNNGFHPYGVFILSVLFLCFSTAKISLSSLSVSFNFLRYWKFRLHLHINTHSSNNNKYDLPAGFLILAIRFFYEGRWPFSLFHLMKNNNYKSSIILTYDTNILAWEFSIIPICFLINLNIY